MISFIMELINIAVFEFIKYQIEKKEERHDILYGIIKSLKKETIKHFDNYRYNIDIIQYSNLIWNFVMWLILYFNIMYYLCINSIYI